MFKFNNITAESPIGVFDSGLGGITVLKEIAAGLPFEDVIYVGDEANFPYGEKSYEEIQRYCIRIADFLCKQGVKFIVIACNTATAAALDVVSQHVAIPVIGVVNAGVKAAVESTKTGNIGVLATTATINSNIYERKILEYNPDLHVESVAAPEFVQFVENELKSVLNKPTDTMIDTIKRYSKPLIEAHCDTVVMGCTHFPVLEPLFKQVMGPDYNFVSPSRKTAEELSSLLCNFKLKSKNPAKYKFYTSGDDYSGIKHLWGKEGSFECICI